jgi:hypothetical protein
MLGRRTHTQARNDGPAPHIARALYRASFMLAILSGSLVGPVPAAAAAAPVTITILASAGAENGVPVYYATATLTGGDDPTGTVTFRVFGPADHTCERPATATSTNPVIGAGDPKRATSDRFVLRSQGVYHFVATYSGDARNAAAGPTTCGDQNAAIGFGVSTFSFAARASGPVAVGGTVSDTATIEASSNLNGTMHFALFGPDAPGCTGTPVFTSTRPVRGNGSYASGPFAPTTPGIYRWVARYAGDADDPNVATPCDDPAQQVAVAPGSPCIVPTGPLAFLHQLFQGLGVQSLSALLGGAGGQAGRPVTACLPAPTPA